MKSALSKAEKAWSDDSDKDEIGILKNQAQKYTENTSIHGLVYLGEEGRSFIERLVNILSTFKFQKNIVLQIF